MIAAVGNPSHSSTPKLEDNRNVRQRTQNTKMANQVEVKRLNISDGGKSVQRTVIEKTYSPAGNRSFASEQRIYPSSYQLRFGARSRASAGYGRGGSVESTITRVTVNDGLEVTPGLISSRAEEKAALGSLNDRFVTYIEKVRYLVNRNQALEAKLKQLEGCQTIPSRAGDMYDAQLHRLQKEIEKAISDKTQVEIELEGCYRDLDDCRKRLQREIEDRKDSENEVKSLCKDVDQATLVRVELEGKVESLREELDLVRRANEEDIRVLTEQLLALRAGGDVVVDGPHSTDLSEALRDIRAAYEQLTQNNKLEIEGYYKSKIADLTDQLREESNQGKNSKAELMDIRRQLQSITVELESTRTSNAALENQLEEMETRNQNELAGCHGIIRDLEQELNAARDKVQRQLVDYNELLNLKLSLDLEIQTYRKLLDGEENRIHISGGIGSVSSDKIQVNIVEQTVTNESKYSDGKIDDEAIDMLQDVVEQQRSEIRKDRGSDRGSSSSSSSSSSSDSESEI